MRRVTLYDSLSRESRLFVPLHSPRVGLFVCALTPYAEAHVGHGRPSVFFDVVARALARWGYRVFSVQNVTNLDDKLIARAAELKVDPLALAERHFLAWRLSLERLGVRSINYYPHATDYLPEILEQVGQLVERGYGYPAEGSVYYEVAKFPEYGKLSGQRVEELRPGARVALDTAKRAPEDFVLWKAATPGEPSWESPWGPGRPGWHIEDTAITVRLLGPRYDLHGAGVDLKFPHHEAEIAQAEGATGQAPLVQFWMHVGLVMMAGEKMSKSIGNVSSLEGAIAAYGPMAVRLFYLNAAYRSPIDFVPERSLDEARDAYATLDAPRQRLLALLAVGGSDRPGRELPPELGERSAALVEELDTVLAEDFNTREAIARLFGWARTIGEQAAHLQGYSGTALESLLAPYRWGEEVLGLFPTGTVDRERIGEVVAVAIDARRRARARGDYAEADAIRSALAAAGVRLEDEGETTRWAMEGPV